MTTKDDEPAKLVDLLHALEDMGVLSRCTRVRVGQCSVDMFAVHNAQPGPLGESLHGMQDQGKLEGNEGRQEGQGEVGTREEPQALQEVRRYLPYARLPGRMLERPEES